MRVIAILMLAVCTAPAEGMARRVTVQLYNAALVPAAELRDSMREAEWILGTAGIDVRWIECPPVMRELGAKQVCRHDGDHGLVVFTILDSRPVDRPEAALGFAILGTGIKHAAAIYPAVVNYLGPNSDCRKSTLLAAVMAHEIGHLLLGSGQHGQGIMTAAWTKASLAAIVRRRLTFTRYQAEAIRSGGW